MGTHVTVRFTHVNRWLCSYTVVNPVHGIPPLARSIDNDKTVRPRAVKALVFYRPRPGKRTTAPVSTMIARLTGAR